MRARILEAALARFQAVGFETTTVAEICEAADVAYGTLFNHFSGKLDLLRALVDASLQTLAERVEAIAKEPGSTRDKLRPLFEMLTHNAAELGPGHRNLVEQMVTLGHQESPADRDRRLHSIFRGFLESGVPRGDVREEELDALTEVLLGAYTSLMLGWVHFDAYPVQRRAEEIVLLLARTLAPQGAGPESEVGDPPE